MQTSFQDILCRVMERIMSIITAALGFSHIVHIIPSYFYPVHLLSTLLLLLFVLYLTIAIVSFLSGEVVHTGCMDRSPR